MKSFSDEIYGEKIKTQILC